MNELQDALNGESAHAAPGSILEGLSEAIANESLPEAIANESLPDAISKRGRPEAVDRRVPGATHTIYEELWHICFWLEISLDWIDGRETPYPVRTTDAFPNEEQRSREGWEQLCARFFLRIVEAVKVAGDETRLNVPVRCPSRPGQPVRTMTVREQLESLAAHDSYHFGRIVLLRQMLGVWPPKSGGSAGEIAGGLEDVWRSV